MRFLAKFQKHLFVVIALLLSVIWSPLAHGSGGPTSKAGTIAAKGIVTLLESLTHLPEEVTLKIINGRIPDEGLDVLFSAGINSSLENCSHRNFPRKQRIVFVHL